MGLITSKEDMTTKYQEMVRKQNPIVHCITNTITICDCANILLAAGASPIMAHHPLEVEEITIGCHSLVLNMGAMDDYEAMLAAAPAAQKYGHPIILDPVGCSGSSFRRKRFRELADLVQISCIRGNAAEIKALALDCQTKTGVDSFSIKVEKEFSELKEMAKQFAASMHTIVIVSGKTDILTDGKNLLEMNRGDPMMSRITGSGCMSSALLGAYLAVENSMESAEAAVRTMCICGERAAKRTREEQRGTMTFHTYLIDEMGIMDEKGSGTQS